MKLSSRFFALLALSRIAMPTAEGYWLMGITNFITTERLDPIVTPGRVSGHVHSVLGGSNFGIETSTEHLRRSDCTSTPIPQDKSAYWFPHLYFQWNNGNFTSLDGGAVIDKSDTTIAFPDDFRMLSGDPTLRSYDPTSKAQQAITFLCLNFSAQSRRYNSLPSVSCPNGIRAQINFPSCWDGKNVDSADHKSHVAYPSGGPDSGTCNDPRYPYTFPRIFLEVYWGSQDFDKYRSQAMNTSQPFVFAHGDPFGYGYHADFINGWERGVLQRAVNECKCNPYGDAKCCADKGIFDLHPGKTCRITKTVDEQTTGTLSKLPGNNPVIHDGPRAPMSPATSTPALLGPVYAYTGEVPTQTGNVVVAPVGGESNHGSVERMTTSEDEKTTPTQAQAQPTSNEATRTSQYVPIIAQSSAAPPPPPPPPATTTPIRNVDVHYGNGDSDKPLPPASRPSRPTATSGLVNGILPFLHRLGGGGRAQDRPSLAEAQGNSVVHEGRSCPKRKRGKAQADLGAVEKRDGEEVDGGSVQAVKEEKENVPESVTVHRLHGHGHGHTHGYEGPSQSHSMRHRPRSKRW